MRDSGAVDVLNHHQGLVCSDSSVRCDLDRCCVSSCRQCEVRCVGSAHCCVVEQSQNLNDAACNAVWYRNNDKLCSVGRGRWHLLNDLVRDGQPLLRHAGVEVPAEHSDGSVGRNERSRQIRVVDVLQLNCFKPVQGDEDGVPGCVCATFKVYEVPRPVEPHFHNCVVSDRDDAKLSPDRGGPPVDCVVRCAQRTDRVQQEPTTGTSVSVETSHNDIS